jgi:hypothetical protein
VLLVNPYKAAIKLVRSVLADNFDSLDDRDKLMNQLVDSELSDLFAWITAEENGLTDQQIKNAHEFVFEGGASGRRTCDACSCGAEVHMLVTRAYSAETKEVYACKAHMLDPGPLLDW